MAETAERRATEYMRRYRAKKAKAMTRATLVEDLNALPSDVLDGLAKGTRYSLVRGKDGLRIEWDNTLSVDGVLAAFAEARGLTLDDLLDELSQQLFQKHLGK